MKIKIASCRLGSYYNMRSIIITGVMVILILTTPLSAAIDSRFPLSSVNCQIEETELGDLVSDALKDVMNVQVAFFPAGALREITIPKGKVEPRQVIECLHYPNDRLAVLELTGEEVVNALERSVSVFPRKNLGFLQVGGLSFTFAPNSPKDYRVLDVKIGGYAIDLKKKYTVATTEPLAKGGYGYFTIWGSANIKEISKITTKEAVEKFLGKMQTVDYSKKDRIRAMKAQ
ncbi:MAG: 5'-nucleotidase C-terminal domain-containing protein [Armatimonadetes bacterium]|nr:5'-nucleotidase C-terminal domain-containing protein [Armatimonadota bacterium]